MTNKLSCQEITTRINEIKTKKAEFDGVFKTDISKAVELKKELQLSISQLKEMLNPVFTIEGKKFPVYKLEIGGKTAKELETELLSKNIIISDYAKYMLNSPDFIASSTIEKIDIVRLKVTDLGHDFADGATTDEIYAKAKELGLELCPIEVGPYQRLKDVDQLRGDYYSIAMKQISGERGRPVIFDLRCFSDGLVLYDHWAEPDKRWDIDDKFVFQVPTK